MNGNVKCELKMHPGIGRPVAVWVSAIFVGLVGAGMAFAYPIVARIGVTAVYAATSRATWGTCPTGAQSIARSQFAQARGAVIAALPTIANEVSPPLRLVRARVSAPIRTRPNGFILPSRRSCWGLPFRRSVLVEVFLPAERSAPSLRGNPWFYVAKTRKGWVIWDEPR